MVRTVPTYGCPVDVHFTLLTTVNGLPPETRTKTISWVVPDAVAVPRSDEYVQMGGLKWGIHRTAYHPQLDVVEVDIQDGPIDQDIWVAVLSDIGISESPVDPLQRFHPATADYSPPDANASISPLSH
jgi:hypothetical protein